MPDSRKALLCAAWIILEIAIITVKGQSGSGRMATQEGQSEDKEMIMLDQTGDHNITLSRLTDVSSGYVSSGSGDEDDDCPEGRYLCSRSRSRDCIPESWLCDGENDCGSWEDEATSICGEPLKCTSSQYRCAKGHCIADSWECDGDNDCGDHSDEAHCDSTCAPGEVICPDQGHASCILASWICDGEEDCVSGWDKKNNCNTNEGNEFFVGFIRNRFGRPNKCEMISPVLWITTKEPTSVNFEVLTITGLLASNSTALGQVTYIHIPLEYVFDPTNSKLDSRFKGIRIKAKGNRKIVVFGQHKEFTSNDAYLALPIILLPAGRSYEYIAASIPADSGAVAQAKDSVILVIGTEDDTEIMLEPSVPISINNRNDTTDTFQMFSPGDRFPGYINIQKFEILYIQAQMHDADISGTRIMASNPISVFSGHECGNFSITSAPCNMLIEQIQPIDTWGIEIVTIPLRTRRGNDIIKVFASQDSTTVRVTRTNIINGTVTSDPSFTLDRNGFRELNIEDFSLIQSNYQIGVFQFSRSFSADSVINSDPFMLSVPSREQYRNNYVVAPAPFDPSLEGTAPGRVAYVNYTNIAIPAEYFNASLITINNNTINASEFKPIRRADNSIWGYGAQLLLNGGAQVIKHKYPNAAFSVTVYGFSNQTSWGCTGGTGLSPILMDIRPAAVHDFF